jgi:hypothetical protein
VEIGHANMYAIYATRPTARYSVFRYPYSFRHDLRPHISGHIYAVMRATNHLYATGKDAQKVLLGVMNYRYK